MLPPVQRMVLPPVQRMVCSLTEASGMARDAVGGATEARHYGRCDADGGRDSHEGKSGSRGVGGFTASSGVPAAGALGGAAALAILLEAT